MSTPDVPQQPGESPQPAPSLPEVPRPPDQVVREAFSAFLAQHWKEPVPCPICKTDGWVILNPVDPPIRYQPGFVATLIPVQCKTCKYVIFFNGVAARLFDSNGTPIPATEVPPPTADSREAEEG